MWRTMLNPKIYGTGAKVILSVEDDDAAYHLLELAFGEVHGDYRLNRVEDGGEALGFLRRSGDYENVPKPNLVLLNLNMPRVSGFDFLEAIKNDATIQHIACVVFSSSTLDKDKAKMPCFGCTGIRDEAH
jgi:CheY-like chemotaxis protein